eukprot:m.63854 g.63854  ORF g.63854 m.63854 type:complete len:56 (+) comp11608_c0_seq1:34-201(+)
MPHLQLFFAEWDGWGNGQIQGTAIGNQYRQALTSGRKYLHAQSRDELYKIIGCTD